MEQKQESPLRLLKKIKENTHALKISRVPPKTKAKFVSWAKEEYCGDFGMALKALVDGMVDIEIIEVMQEVDLLKQQQETLRTELDILKENLPVEEGRTVKMLNGKEVKIK